MQTIAQIEAEMLEAEAHQEYKGYKVSEIRKVFDAMADPDDWRAPIEAWIDHKLFGIAAVATEFFTCTELKVIGGPEPLTGRILVQADGYRNGPAGP
jgi:hypothetical protein